MLRTMFPRAFLIGAAASVLFSVPVLAGDDDTGASRPHPDHAWYGDRDYSRCFWQRPLDVFRDGEGGYELWRTRHACGHRHDGGDSGQYGHG